MGDVVSCSRCDKDVAEDSEVKVEVNEDRKKVSTDNETMDTIAPQPEAAKLTPLTEKEAPTAATTRDMAVAEAVAEKSPSGTADSSPAGASPASADSVPSQVADRSDYRQITLRANQEMMQTSLAETMANRHEGYDAQGPANRFSDVVRWPEFVPGQHVPVLALLNPLSGAGAGRDILRLAASEPYFQDRFFGILEVVKGQQIGGMMDVFRTELNKAKDEAKAMGCRPRLISGGGDGTASFALTIVFMALRANEHNDLLGFSDKGNGFVWSDEEMAESFPALAQMPLGSANDCAHILGWGQKYPGDREGPTGCCMSRASSARRLSAWIEATMRKSTATANFDVWGILPKPGSQEVDFRLAELEGARGRCPNQRFKGKRQIALKQAGKPVPFFVCLYFSAGFGAYMTARFQLNRRRTPIRNRMEYTRQALGILLESTPPQLCQKLENVEIDCEGDAYFPPRRNLGQRGRKYREVGFYNINWQANALHGADRAGLFKRLCGRRKPVRFDDGLMDMFRWNIKSVFKNPGLRIQTDKKRDMCLKFDGSKGKGVFFQWDGESRFAFSPSGDPFHIYCRKVLRIPVLLGPQVDPRLTGDLETNQGVAFQFVGESEADVAQVRSRILQMVVGDLDEVMLASENDRGAVAAASGASMA